MKTCTNCGNRFEGNFCPNCGTKAEARCPGCGAPAPAGAKFCGKCGARLEAAQVPAGAPARPYAAPQQTTYAPAQQPYAPAPNAYPAPVPGGPSASVYTGGAFGLFFARLWVFLVSVISLTLLMPAMICFFQRFKAKRTYIDGRRLVFTGKGISLFGKYLLWLLLCIITIGIYGLWVNVRLRKWIAQHTHFEGETAAAAAAVSDYNGGALACFGVYFVATLVTIITLTFGLYWAVGYVSRWHAKHTTLDGHVLMFDGKGTQLFGKVVLWTFLTIITVGIFSFWFAVKCLKWHTSHIHALPAAA